MDTHKQKTSFSLTPEALQLLKLMAAALGIPQSAVLEMALRAYAQQQGVAATT